MHGILRFTLHISKELSEKYLHELCNEYKPEPSQLRKDPDSAKKEKSHYDYCNF